MYGRVTLAILLSLFLSFTSMAAAQTSLTVTLEPDKNAAQQNAQSDLTLKHETRGTTQGTQYYRANVPEKKNGKGESLAIARVGVTSVNRASIRSRPDRRGRTYFVCPKDTPLAILGQNGSYYGVLMADCSTGWIAKDSVRLLDCPVLGTPAGAGGLGYRAVRTAFQFLGIPYRWGGSSVNGLDCSAFVRAVFGNLGVNLPRVARDQAQVGAEVPFGDLQPGDRLYFACKRASIDHAGIYIGNGSFIHSSVSRGGVAIDNILSPFYLNSLVVARRS